MAEFKRVNYVINVPAGKYCWKGYTCCEFFDNEGGTPHCKLGFWEVKTDRKTGYALKSPKCVALQDVKS